VRREQIAFSNWFDSEDLQVGQRDVPIGIKLHRMFDDTPTLLVTKAFNIDETADVYAAAHALGGLRDDPIVTFLIKSGLCVDLKTGAEFVNEMLATQDAGRKLLVRQSDQ
jgi:hypothetical protein